MKMGRTRPTDFVAFKIVKFFVYLFAAAILLIIAAGTLHTLLDPQKSLIEADEGFKRAQRTINSEELRKWALQTAQEHSRTDNPKVSVSEIPSSIRNLYSTGPEDAVISQNGGVIIIWGGGTFHWVIEIEDTNFLEPFIKSRSEEYPYSFEWTNGIYYSREAGKKLQ